MIPSPVVHSLPSFDPASLLWRLRQAHPGMPLIHIDREGSTGWSHVPVRVSRVLEDGPLGLLRYGEDGSPRVGSEGGWDDPFSLLSQPLANPLVGKGTAQTPDGPPFSEGLVVLLPFEMAERWEPSGGPFRAPMVPAVVADCPEVVSWHAPTRRLYVPRDFDLGMLEPVSFTALPPVTLVPSLDCVGFSRMFLPIQDGLERGDYFQVNIALRFSSDLPDGFDPLAAYARLLGRSRGRYGGFFSFGSRFLISHSPEQLLSIEGDRIRTRPIAGTAAGVLPPGSLEPLHNDSKLLAEHIMIVDLLRNDIGRCALPGSVTVPSLLSIETYPHLRHLVSEVTGLANPRLSRADVIRSLFPGGSVTGAPRIRVRKEIGRLEGTPRNYYCGALGFVSGAGNTDMALLIRTLEGTVAGSGKGLVFGAGAGIVADSRMEEEYGEICLKARAMGEILS